MKLLLDRHPELARPPRRVARNVALVSAIPIIILAAVAACTPSVFIDVRGESVEVGRTVPGFRHDHAARRPEHAHPLHPAVIEYLFLRPELPFLDDPDDPEQVARAREAAQKTAPIANTYLATDGAAKFTGFKQSGDQERYCELIVHWPGLIVIARAYISKGLGMMPVDYGLDLADIPEAFDPTAAITVEDVAQRGRFLAELL